MAWMQTRPQLFWSFSFSDSANSLHNYFGPKKYNTWILTQICTLDSRQAKNLENKSEQNICLLSLIWTIVFYMISITMIFQSQDGCLGCLNSFRTCNLSVVVPWLMRLCLSQFNLSKFWKHISLTNEHACGNVVFAEDQYLCVWITDLSQTTLLPFILPSSIEAMNVGHLLILVQLFLAIEDLYLPWLSFITRHCINFCCKKLF